jgi:hypothetical protein
MLADAQDEVRIICDKVDQIMWDREVKEPTIQKLREDSALLFGLLEESPKDAVIMISVFCQLKGAPRVVDKDYCQGYAFRQSEDHPGTVGISHNYGGGDWDRANLDAEIEVRRSFFQGLFDTLGVPLAAERIARLDYTGEPGVGVRSNDPRFKVRAQGGDPVGASSIRIEPHDTAMAASIFGTLTDSLLEELYSYKLTIGGHADTVRGLADKVFTPTDYASFNASTCGEWGDDWIERLESMTEGFTLTWLVQEVADFENLFLDVTLIRKELEIEVELSSRRFWDVDKTIHRMEEEWGIGLEFVREW